VQLGNTDTILRPSSPFWEDALSKPLTAEVCIRVGPVSCL